MSRIPPTSRALSASFAAVALVLLLGLAWQGPGAGPGPVLKPFVVEAARARVPVAGQLLVYDAQAGRETELVELVVAADGYVVERLDLGARLVGDPEYGAVNALIERLPEELAHRHGDEERVFAAPDAPTLHGPEAVAAEAEIRARVAAMVERYASGRAPYVHVDFVLPLDQVFPEDAVPGQRAAVSVELRWRAPAGPVRVSTVRREVVWLGPAPGLPSSFQAGHPAASVHAGDLHVHSCHGEAANACAPSSNCAAESFQTSGSFTYAQLKSQYQALGLDWFTATDHSYCIDSDAEYTAIVAETAAITDGSFLCIPDIELSSDEEGPQQGSDTGDTLCLGFTSANHMGAHGISSRTPGGGPGFLGFCSGLDGFTANFAKIRAQGGYPIANHPEASSFGWTASPRRPASRPTACTASRSGTAPSSPARAATSARGSTGSSPGGSCTPTRAATRTTRPSPSARTTS